MKQINTVPGASYAITPKVDGTIKTASGRLIATVDAGKQQIIVAPESLIVASDNDVIVTESFKGASAGSSAGGGVSLDPEQLNFLGSSSYAPNVSTVAVCSPFVAANPIVCSVAIGDCSPVGDYCVSVGSYTGGGNGSVSVGESAQSKDNAVAVGYTSYANILSVAAGAGARAEVVASVSVGGSAIAYQESIAIGYNTIVNGYRSCIIGSNMASFVCNTSIISAHNGNFLFSFLGVDHSGETPRLIAGVYDKLAGRVTTGGALPMTDFVALMKANGGSDYSFDNLQPS